LIFFANLVLVGKPMYFMEAALGQYGQVITAFEIFCYIKGIVSPDWKDLQMVSLDRFEV
jgi:SNF family Na+-dependent transporter